MKGYLTVSDIAKTLEINPYTVYRWIEWYFSDLPKPEGIYLPSYTLKGTYKLFKQSDLIHFINFRESLPFGAMREYNRYRFGKGEKDAKVREAIKHSRYNQRAQSVNMQKLRKEIDS